MGSAENALRLGRGFVGTLGNPGLRLAGKHRRGEKAKGIDGVGGMGGEESVLFLVLVRSDGGGGASVSLRNVGGAAEEAAFGGSGFEATLGNLGLRANSLVGVLGRMEVLEGVWRGCPALGSFGRFQAASIVRRGRRVGGWVSTCVHKGWGERKRGFGVWGGLGLGRLFRAEWPGLVDLGLGSWLDWFVGLGLGFAWLV